MKRHRLFTVLGALAVAVCAAAAVRAGEIVYLEGNVQVQSGEDKEWKKAEKGMTVNIGDSIRTARHSRADIALDAEKKNTIRLEEKTLAVLNSVSPDTIDRLDLARGRVYANLEGIKSGMGFEVNTPSAVAGVRGSFWGVYTERDSDEISAYQDTVYLRTYDAENNLLSETMLPEGFKTFIERFDLPSTFQSIDRGEYMESDSIRDHVTGHAEGREAMREERQEQQNEQQNGEQSNEQRMEQTELQTLPQNDVLETKEQQQENKQEERLEDFTEPSSPEVPSQPPEEYMY